MYTFRHTLTHLLTPTLTLTLHTVQCSLSQQPVKVIMATPGRFSATDEATYQPCWEVPWKIITCQTTNQSSGYSRSPEIFKSFWEIPFTWRLWNKKHPVNEGFSVVMLYFRRIVMEQGKANNKQNTVLRLTCGIVLAGGLWFLTLSEQIDRCRQPDTLHFGLFR